MAHVVQPSPAISFTPLHDTAMVPDNLSTAFSQTRNRLHQLADSFEADYTTCSDVITVLSDQVVDLHSQRHERVRHLQENIATSVKERKAFQQATDNTAEIERLKREIDRLRSEKRELEDDIHSYRQVDRQLRSDLEKLSQEIKELKDTRNRLMAQSEKEIGTMQYFHHLLQTIAKVRIMRTPDPNVVTGFIGKSHTNDLIPFSFKKDEPHSEAVSAIWESISK